MNEREIMKKLFSFIDSFNENNLSLSGQQTNRKLLFKILLSIILL